jgi:hypothetical protein
MCRIFEDGWYWLSTLGEWEVVRVQRGYVYLHGTVSCTRADDAELNKLTRVKIEPPNLDYAVAHKYS